MSFYRKRARPPIMITKSQHQPSLRDWWHNILRDYGNRYACSAIFLVLPSDKEALHYLIDFGNELDIISGDDCLVIALGNQEFRRSGFDVSIKNSVTSESEKDSDLDIAELEWLATVKEHAAKGYSVQIAQLFDIELTKFPCMLVFKDIRSPDHVIVSLKGMTRDEIAERMRSIFSIIHKAVSDRANPLNALTQYQNSDDFQKAGKTILSKITSYTEKTFETAIAAWINSTVK